METRVTPLETRLNQDYADGDPAALRALYSRYGGPMLTAALHLLWGERHLAEEAVQSAMLKAWRAAPTFDPTRALAPWLYAIVRRCAIDISRREQRHRIDSLDAAVREPADRATDDFETAWEAWTVREALDELPDDEHEILRLAYFGSLTHSEIAAHLDIPLGTVKSRSSRAHSRLRDHLGERLALVG
jgi:RNA polymerase sigma-70 factor, ECF subfamily